MSLRATAVFGLLAALACDTPEEAKALPTLDVADFRCNVQPVIAARCAFLACHGSGRRPFRAYARGRLRLEIPRHEIVTGAITHAELDANFEMARGFAADDRFDRSPLLLKPLDPAAGGHFHVATDLFGEQDVFTSTDDPGYQKLAAWLDGATSDAACRPTTEVGQ